MSTTWWDTVATLSYLAAVTERVRLLSHVYVLPVPASAGGRQGVGDARSAVGRPRDPRRRHRARGRRVRRARRAVRRPWAAARRGHRRGAGRARRRVRRRTTASAGSSTTSGSVRGRCSQPCRSGSADRRSRPCAAPPSAATVGCRRARRRAGWRPASSSSAPTAPPRVATNPSCSARCRARSTSATRAGRRRAACAARPRRSPATSAPTRSSGVDQIQVGFVSRSVDELCDQIAAFAADVAPLVNEGDRLMLLEGKVAIVSGIGPGMGRDISLQLAEHGADVVLGARRTEKSEEVAEEVRALGRRAEVVQLDITDAAACEEAVARAVGALGGRRHPREQRLPRRQPQGVPRRAARGVAADDGRELLGHACR